MVADREREDRRAALFAMLSAGVMIAQQVGSKATRDALFLSSFEPEDLPRVVIAAAAASMLAVFAASRGYARFGPARVVPVAFALSALLYVVEWLAAPTAGRIVAVVLYLHTAVFGALVISGFWSVMNERFDPHTAKKVIGRIGMGATFGGVAGGLLAHQVGERLDASAMLVALAALNAVAGIGVSRIGSTATTPAIEGPRVSALSVLKQEPYLRTLAGLVLLTAMAAGLIDWAFKAEAHTHFDGDSSALLSFFAIFHVVAAIVSLVFQTGLAKPALEKLGVAGSVATVPTIVLVTASIAAVFTGLATAVVARASELVLANSIFRSGYELLYTPIALEKKRPTKTLIDVAGNRVGDAIGSGCVLVVLALIPDLGTKVVLALGALFAAASLIVARQLHQGYVGQLEASLRSGTPMEAEAVLLARAATLSTLGLDREMLFEQLAAHQSWGDRVSQMPATASVSGNEPLEPKEPDGIDAPDDDPVHDVAHRLRRGDTAAIRGVLNDGPIDRRLVQHSIALLARRDVYRDAVNALREIADDVEDQLVASLVDRDQPFAIRRRLPRVLEVCDGEASAEGLARGLDDDRFEVRYRCALALGHIASRRPDRKPTSERVHAVVARELETGKKTWNTRRVLDADDSEENAPLMDKALRNRIHRSVEYVFTLLSLAYDPDPLKMSLFALAGEEQLLRGTALEYLESILPEEITIALFPMLDVRVEIHRKRSKKEIVDDLVMRSIQAMDKNALEEAIAAREKRKKEQAKERGD